MNFTEYEQQAAQTAIYPRDVHPFAPVYPALGLVGESGEIAEKVKKIIRDGGCQPLSERERLDLVREAGDVLWYLAAFARDIGSSLDEVAQTNLDKLRDRSERGKIAGSGDHR